MRALSWALGGMVGLWLHFLFVAGLTFRVGSATITLGTLPGYAYALLSVATVLLALLDTDE